MLQLIWIVGWWLMKTALLISMRSGDGEIGTLEPHPSNLPLLSIRREIYRGQLRSLTDLARVENIAGIEHLLDPTHQVNGFLSQRIS